MPVRPYTLLGADVLAAARRQLDALLASWCDDWGLARDALVLECQRAWEGVAQLPAAPAWNASWRSGDARLALAWPTDWTAQLQRLMFAPEPRPAALAALAAGAAAAAWDAWQRSLAQALLPQADPELLPSAPLRTDWERASGALLVTLRIGRHACHACLSHALLQVLAQQARQHGQLATASQAPLAPLNYAALLAPLPVQLPVELGRVELGLGSLMGLGVGDVIRLTAPAEQPLPVSGPGGQILFAGYLGLQDDSVALEIVRHHYTME